MAKNHASSNVPYADAHDEARAEGLFNKLSLYNGRKASLQLSIVVVGCGLGGLAAAHTLSQAGHKVTVLESAPAIGEVGAGIQVTPNVARLLIRWGLEERLKKIGVLPVGIVLRRWQSGEIIGETPLGDSFAKEHGAPYYQIHRADFHRLLYDLAIPNVDLRLNSSAKSVDPFAPSCTLASGEVIKGDLVIGADGVKSMIREVVIGRQDQAEATGDAAYRAIIPAEKLLADPELKHLIERPEMTAWLGPGRHIMGYPIRARQEYNIVLLHPDDGSVESWTAEGSAEKMRVEFKGWEPRIKKLLEMVPYTLKWKLMDRKPLDTWIHPAGKVVLLGDACHPMLPYRAQGAGMAIEDATTLASLLSFYNHPSQLPLLLRTYQSLRLPRTSATQASSRLNQYINHLPDGPEQEERDADMRAGNKRWNQWNDKEKSREQFGWDADEVVERWYKEGGEMLLKRAVLKAKL